MHFLDISTLLAIFLSAFLIATEGLTAATILTSPGRRHRHSQGVRVLRITRPRNLETSEEPISTDTDDHPNQVRFGPLESTDLEETQSPDESNRSRGAEYIFKNPVKTDQPIPVTKVITLKQLMRDQEKLGRLESMAPPVNSDVSIDNSNVHHRSPWWSRGKEGLQWKRNKDTGFLEVVQLED